jgi:hypothetical protein
VITASTNTPRARSPAFLDLCDDFVALARATARILLVASATDDAMTDVRGDGFAAENAATTPAIWRNLIARFTEPRN